jgi:hypothetical protein
MAETMLHTTFWMNRLGKVRVVASLAVLGASSLAFAGDPIVIGGEKPKTAPGTENKAAAREVFRLRDSVPDSPFDVLSVPMLQEKKRLDPKEEKRRRLQELEKKNWMMVDQGQLQAEEDDKNFLNVREYSVDGIEKQDESGNLMFRPLSKDDTRRIPGQFRSATDKARQNGPRDSGTGEEPEAPGLARPDKDPQVGAHMSTELNFRQMFESRQAGNDSLTPKFNKSDLTLQSLLNAGGNTENVRDQQARREDFRNFLNKPVSPSPLAGPSDPINGRSDFTRQPLNPTTPQPFNAQNPATFGRATLGSVPGNNRFNPAFSPSPHPAASPFLTPQDTPRGGQRPGVNFEPPKRKF